MTARTHISRREMMFMPLVFPLALGACNRGAEVLRLTGQTFGTTYNVVAIDHGAGLEAAGVQAAIDIALAEVDAALSNWRADSEISQINALPAGETAVMSADLAEVMAAAEAVHAASLGRFDTTMGGLIELWGFGASGTRAKPTDAAIAAEAARAGHANMLAMDGETLRKKNGDAQIFLAGIGKGFGADRVARALTALGINDFMVEIGGDLVTAGSNPDGQPWQIGIETPNPGDRSVYDVVGLSGLGLATSGDYRNYFEADGHRYSHLIDPTTGAPVTHTTASATVLAENAMLADAWSTAMLILGRARGLEVAAAHGVAVQFIERGAGVEPQGFETYVSEAFAALTA